ncbi:hypothetical protein [Bradymonas sediminis]|uniref:hypothetical protein n=1 Tax=Bradymonas sediminis TaxID=1548548 RepID=UPI00105DFE2F|nr:hypothetical protein [Bradymonas sediminis]TDP77239.1 hypothetical protein DFR33_101139 [Bradymonas sediminis]
MRSNSIKLAILLLSFSAGCSAPLASDEPGAWELNTNHCPEGALVDVDLPDVDVFAQPVCLVNHPADEVQIQWSSELLLRPECSTDIFEDPRELGYYGRVGFITDRRITNENNDCTPGFMQSCTNFNIYIRLPRVSEIWHRFEVRRPNESCDYSHAIYESEYYWFWRFEIGGYLGIAHFRSDIGNGYPDSALHHIEIFDQTCGRVSNVKKEEVIQQFSVVDILFESLPSKKALAYHYPEPEFPIYGDAMINFYTPLVTGCVISNEDNWTRQNQ